MGLHADLSNAAYHAETDWLSSSMLKGLLPEHYKGGGNEDALLFGTLFHVAVLEPERLATFADDHALRVLDAAKVGVKANGEPADNPRSTKAWKEAIAEAEKAGQRVIDRSMWDAWLEQVEAMRQAVVAHDTAADLLFNREGSNELSAFAEVDGQRCRARFDRHISGAIVDLKSTTAKPGRKSLGYAIRDWLYDLSAAHYLAVAEALGIDVQAFVLVFVGKEPPHYVTVVDLSEQTIHNGRAMRQQAINRHLGLEDAYEGAHGYLTI
jgi:hypothetical protein